MITVIFSDCRDTVKAVIINKICTILTCKRLTLTVAIYSVEGASRLRSPPLAKDWRSHKLRRYGGGEALGEAIAPPRRKGFVPVGEFRHFGRGLLVGSML